MSNIEVSKPWERLLEESDEQWLAFRCYRDQAMPRRIDRSASKSYNVVIEWFSKHRWAERAHAYDAHLESVKLETREALLRQSTQEIALEHMAMLASTKEFVTNEMQKLLQLSKDSEVSAIKPNELQKFFEMAIKLDRLVRNQSTENLAEAVKVDVSGLSVDELKELRRLHEKIGLEE